MQIGYTVRWTIRYNEQYEACMQMMYINVQLMVSSGEGLALTFHVLKNWPEANMTKC